MVNNPKKIAVNGRYLNAKSFTGVQNWSLNVIRELSQEIEVREIRPSALFSSGFLGHFWEQFLLPFHIRRNEFLLSPANFGPVLLKKQIVVIHDILPITNPEYFSKSYIRISTILHRLLISRVLFVATPSEFTLEQLRLINLGNKRPISVLGFGTRFGTEICQSNSAPIRDESPRYFIAFGGSNIRKNNSFLTSFWPEIYKKTLCELIIVARTEDLVHQTMDFPIPEGVKVRANLDDSELLPLFSGSVALLWPSLAEGIGLPLIESLSLGIPYVSTDSGAAKELRCGDSKVLELDQQKWIAEIENLIYKYDHNSIQREQHLLRAKDFSWAQVASRIVRLISH